MLKIKLLNVYKKVVSVYYRFIEISLIPTYDEHLIELSNFLISKIHVIIFVNKNKIKKVKYFKFYIFIKNVEISYKIFRKCLRFFIFTLKQKKKTNFVETCFARIFLFFLDYFENYPELFYFWPIKKKQNKI